MTRRVPTASTVPNNPSQRAARLAARFDRARALHQQGRLAEARALYLDVLRKQPKHADCLHMLGLVAYQTGDYQRSADLIARAIKLSPRQVALYNNRGLALERLGQLEAAVANYDQAIEFEPAGANAWVNRGNALRRLGRLEAAVANYDRAIALNGISATAYLNRGSALRELHQLEAALASYDKAIELAPNTSAAWYNRANALTELGELEAAVAAYNRAIVLQSPRAEVLVNLAVALKELNRLDEAVATYDQALAIEPAHAAAAWNKARALLLIGDFEHGWKLYERRWETTQRSSRRGFRQPLWLGDAPLDGTTILLHAEQGLGDTLQFCRFAAPVAARGARVVMEVPKALAKVLADVDGVSQWVIQGESLPDFDCHCPLLSLPLALRTTLASIPARKAYLRADPAKIEHWARRLGEKTVRRVGLAWSGRAEQVDDRNRSIALSHLLAHLPAGWEYISLQKEVRDGDAITLRQHPAIHHFGEALEDFADTAALCSLVDVVISVDTSVAHLAGALGARTWILLPFSPDWRWLLGRDDSPWYSSVRLYRQGALGDWADPLAKLRADLSSLSFELSADSEPPGAL